jgi:hypothetical protein
MTVMVNDKEKELVAIGINGIEWTEDLLGNHDALNYDEEAEVYVMSEEDFKWWEELIDKLSEIQELEQALTREEYKEYIAQLGGSDLDAEIDHRLIYLKYVIHVTQ